MKKVLLFASAAMLVCSISFATPTQEKKKEAKKEVAAKTEQAAPAEKKAKKAKKAAKKEDKKAETAPKMK